MNARSTLERLSELANTYFVGLVLLASAAALAQPDLFTWIAPYISPLLGLIMLGMGLTLQPADFRRLAERPRDVAIGALAQWLVMPTAAYALTVVLSLPPELAVGVILVGAAPGGTASNVMAYLGKGDVALSVAITTVTTLAAPLVMPAWVVALAGEQLQVGFVDLFLNIVQIVFIPVVLGFALRVVLDRNAPEVAEVGLDVFPLVSVLSIVAIVAAVVGLNVDTILGAGAAAIGAVVLHNAIGLGTGYGTGRLAGCPRTASERPRSKSASRTAGSRRPSRCRSSRPPPPCRPRCSASGTTSPARSSPATSRELRATPPVARRLTTESFVAVASLRPVSSGRNRFGGNVL